MSCIRPCSGIYALDVDEVGEVARKRLNQHLECSIIRHLLLVSLPLVLLLLYFIYAYDCVEKIVLLLVVGGGSLLFEFRLIVRIDLGYVNDFSRVIPQQVGQTNDEGESKQKK